MRARAMLAYAIAPLSRKEEAQLAVAARDGDKAALDKLLRANLKLLYKTALYFGRGDIIDELFQQGVVGFCEAVQRFDVVVGTKFNSYAMHWVRMRMHRHLNSAIRPTKMPSDVGSRTVANKLRKARLSFVCAYGRDASLVELAEHIGKGVQEHHVMGVELSTRRALPYGADRANGEIECAAAALDPEQQCANDELLRGREHELRNALAKMPPLHRDIIERRYLGGTDDLVSMAELGRLYGVTRERIRQIELQAMRYLRAALLKDRPLPRLSRRQAETGVGRPCGRARRNPRGLQTALQTELAPVRSVA